MTHNQQKQKSDAVAAMAMPHLRPGYMPHVALERLAQGQAHNRDIAALIDRDSVSVREMLNKLIGRGLVVMAKRRLGRGNPYALYEITDAGRAELERLGPARQVRSAGLRIPAAARSLGLNPK